MFLRCFYIPSSIFFYLSSFRVPAGALKNRRGGRPVAGAIPGAVILRQFRKVIGNSRQFSTGHVTFSRFGGLSDEI